MRGRRPMVYTPSHYRAYHQRPSRYTLGRPTVEVTASPSPPFGGNDSSDMKKQVTTFLNMGMKSIFLIIVLIVLGSIMIPLLLGFALAKWSK